MATYGGRGHIYSQCDERRVGVIRALGVVRVTDEPLILFLNEHERRDEPKTSGHSRSNSSLIRSLMHLPIGRCRIITYGGNIHRIKDVVATAILTAHINLLIFFDNGRYLFIRQRF